MFHSISTDHFVLISLMILFSVLLINLVWHTWFLGIGPTPSTQNERERISTLCLHLFSLASSRGFTPQVYELGSGWGGLSFYLKKEANKQKLSFQIIGYEYAQVPYWSSKLINFLSDDTSTKHDSFTSIIFKRKDLLEAFKEVKEGDLLLAYLCPQQMQRIEQFLEHLEQPLGAYLLSLTFALPQLKAKQIETRKALFYSPLYLYEI